MKPGLYLENVCFKYDNMDENNNAYILNHINLNIQAGEYVAIAGKTGSGKTTLLQHFNGLLKATEGKCYYNGEDIHAKGYSLRSHRLKIAYCFQYPEYQLFEETVIKDIAFGPKNQGLSEAEALQCAREAMKIMNLSEELENVSPFTLSGGQKRKVALAGLLAMNPEVLLLDEPVAGLDYEGKKNLFQILKRLNQDKNMTIIMISHNMNDIAEQADRLILLEEGRILADGDVNMCISDQSLMASAGLKLPDATRYYYQLRENNFGKKEAAQIPVTTEQLAKYIAGELT